MGPRLGRVEYKNVDEDANRDVQSFNGATLRTRGILLTDTSPCLIHPRFNGATLRTRRIRELNERYEQRNAKLQWGHA